MNLRQAISAIAGGMIGIRRKEHAEQDFRKLKFWHILVIGFSALALLVGTLVVLANLIVG